MKKVVFNEKKNIIYNSIDLLYTQEILDIILNFFTYSIRKRIKYRNIYDSKFKEIFDKIEWIEQIFKNEEFDDFDVFFTIFDNLEENDNFNDIKNYIINYDYNIFFYNFYDYYHFHF